MAKTLLLVDDEENILRSLARLFRRDDYQVLTANSGADGLKLLETNNVGVVISDQRMPNMSGVEFLRAVKKQCPATVRIVLSGYTDLKSVTDAINEGAIYKFLTKPWDDDLLRANVREAFRRYELVQENERLGQELKKVNENLRIANEAMAANAEQRNQAGAMNIRALQVIQEILEAMPFAVLGIGEDGMIAVANGKAAEILGPVEFGLLGNQVEQVVPVEILACYRRGAEGNGLGHETAVIAGRTLEIWAASMGGSSMATGGVLLILPRGQDHEEVR
ncbi:MAG: response regulator receiver [Gammaproteobacteria bacterium]|nr:MAG: response regulator receiver [Gammaproteobacteria bacterium]TND02449.1 MAG: response regulator receiver protein [Gammaproteobacteria bacterium]